jgi:glucose-6-phosphate dehydrogenase assembly protein OpcA
MPATADSFAPGMPVEIGNIDCELKRLWRESGGEMTRASLMNLAVYSEAPNSLQQNTQSLFKITEDHACRAIIISADPAATENQVKAWISAHCHVSRAGSKQICSEQLSFRLEGPCSKLLPNIVFSHLDSDLPFYLWWQGEFHDPMDPQLWAWVDRVIYDSQSWSDFGAQMTRVETAQAEAKQRIVLCDLNWTRLVQIRLALAQFFDHSASQRCFKEIQRIQIDFGPGYRSTALLLTGWLAAQLQWTLEMEAKEPNALTFRSRPNRSIQVALHETPGEPISRCLVDCGPMRFCVIHSPKADLLEIGVTEPSGERKSLMPASRNDPVQLMSEELERGGPHRVYLRAMTCVRRLL